MTDADIDIEIDDASAKPSLCVLEAVARANDVDPVDLDPSLADAIDPTALDRLFEPAAVEDSVGRRRLSFEYHEYHVTVHASNRVDVA